MAQRALTIDPTSLLLTLILYHKSGIMSIGKCDKVLEKKDANLCKLHKNAPGRWFAARRMKRGRSISTLFEN